MPAELLNNLFDHESMLARLKGDVEHAVDLISLYQRHSPRMLNEVRKAVEARDAAALASAAHAFKGASSHVHAVSVQSAALRLEFIGRTDDLTNMDAAMDKLVQEWSKLLESLAGFVQTRAVNCSN